MTTETADEWFDPEVTTFGDRVAGARELAGMDQETLAKRLGVRLETLKSWEDDMTEPRANKLSMMAGLLNVSLFWLLSGEGVGPDTPETASGLAPDMSDVLSEIVDLKAQMTRAAERLARLETRLRTALESSKGG